MAVAILAGALSTGAATADQTGTDGAAAMNTESEYVEFLEEQGSAEARETLSGFKALPAEDKSKFLNYLDDPEILTAFLDESSGDSVREDSDVPETMEARQVTKYNQDVSFVREARVSTEASMAATPSASWTNKATYSFSQKMFGVTITKFTVWVRYQATRTGYKVLKVHNSGSSLRNFNV
ncbi:hypothetical protein [Streptomyces sp. NPDC060022]|uniref:hypothetical protein n=1 Tax=Streptomyces sp. NPDC060022 TaxID=3347039 RepID=UPI003675BFFE